MSISKDLIRNYPFLQAIQQQTEWLDKLVPSEIKAFQVRQKALSAQFQSPMQQALQSIIELDNLWKKQLQLIGLEEKIKFDSFLLSEIEQVQRITKSLERYFSQRDLTISFDDLLEEPINDSAIEPLNEQEQAIVSEIIEGKEPSPSSLSNKVSIRKILSHIYFFLQLYINMQFYLQGVGVDISPKYIYENFTSPRSAIEQILAICDKYPTSGRSYGARTVSAPSGLNLRKYDHKKSEIITTLPNDQFICVLKEPRDNAQWILVAAHLDNGEVVKGYVARKYTSQIK
ncbi:SH3 domain-containing protein [Mannheimia haemolytica]|uniref:SH3 domain-containing protein n=1 Tax=Mannheimia haemolytica TaxID=75985 RepID=UPI002EBA4781|nr:SH3 domain-containing protein [Mannheimia haemolytica]